MSIHSLKFTYQPLVQYLYRCNFTTCMHCNRKFHYLNRVESKGLQLQGSCHMRPYLSSTLDFAIPDFLPLLSFYRCQDGAIWRLVVAEQPHPAAALCMSFRCNLEAPLMACILSVERPCSHSLAASSSCCNYRNICVTRLSNVRHPVLMQNQVYNEPHEGKLSHEALAVSSALIHYFSLKRTRYGSYSARHIHSRHRDAPTLGRPD